jgi:hypothetical protein
MMTFRSHLVLTAATIATLGNSVQLKCQAISAPNQSDSISIHIALQKKIYAVGENPIAILSIKNLTTKEIFLSNASYLYRIHMMSNNVEPLKTELHRHLLGDFRSGDGPGVRADSVGRSITVGSVDEQKYDLSKYYVLTKPGNYSVYFEMYDPAGPKDQSGHWLRTNSITFRLILPAP